MTYWLAAEPTTDPWADPGSGNVSAVGIQTEGPLFEAVQLRRIFVDSKTFVDAVPVVSEPIIAARFGALDSSCEPDRLRQFVEEHFALRSAPLMRRSTAATADEFVASNWESLLRLHSKSERGSTLIAVPYPYVVPGGRFDELFYWDSFFTGLGMLRHGHLKLYRGMVDDLIVLQRRFGHIPNGNRTYLTSRSQPPLLAAMVRSLGQAGVETDAYLPALLREHTYWTSGERVAAVVDGVVLSRYWDERDTPRPEAFVEDRLCAARARDQPVVYRHLRAGAASGWDFSSRWCDDPADLATIETTDVIPVDLNALLFQLERTIAALYRSCRDASTADQFEGSASARALVLQTRCWDQQAGWFFDLDRGTGARRPSFALSGMVPLAVQAALPEQANIARRTLIERFLAPGGLRSTTVVSGQQWDAPNGWAPLHWWAVTGLRAYGFSSEADEVSRRWLMTCRQRFLVDGTLLEKYNVEDPSEEPGGGEYVVQEGFGWTNGVLADLADGLGDR